MTGLVVRAEVPGRLDVAFEAAPGEVLAVIGPNGAGKSTLLESIAGLVPMTGQLGYAGADLRTTRVRDRGVGLVFQDQRLFPHLSALENVAFGLRATGRRRREADQTAQQWLERLGLGGLAERRPDQLSGGQAQRVALARALATTPDILLLDEPMAGLDVGVAATLRSELARHLADFPGVAILVTHEAVDALTLADRLLVLEGGRIAQQGTTSEVTSRPRTGHVARLVGLNLVPDPRTPEQVLVFGPEQVVVSRQPAEDSTRLRWRGEIGHSARHDAGIRLVVHTDTGGDVLADVTLEAATDLALERGTRVWLAVKESGVRRHLAAAERSPQAGG